MNPEQGHGSVVQVPAAAVHTLLGLYYNDQAD